ncbi:MAG: glycosyltransferase family 2 protein [Acidobacteria bacterium]|nr:glycosyltransferase family 2 protein [Acidobacteriota bacterium]
MIQWLILLNKLIVAYYAFALSAYGLLIVAALWSSGRHRKMLKGQTMQRFLGSTLTPPVSILVPAYNEEFSISESVRSLLRLQYPDLEVVVINDGSTDGTLQSLCRDFALVPTRLVYRPEAPSALVRNVYISLTEPHLIVIDKENGGKSDALNAGLNFARSPYFCTIDADAVLEPDALLRVMLPVLNSRSLVIASGGIVRVVNGCRIENGMVREVRLPRRPVEVLQVVEYLRGFLFGREGWSALNSLLIISGAFGVFSRQIALEIGGYRRDTVGEDMDLVVRMHRHMLDTGRPYRVVFIPDPVCWTEAPWNLRLLARQRRRWQKGLLDVLWQNRRMMLNPRYGRIGLIGFPYQVAVELLGPIVEAVGILSIILSSMLGIFGTFPLLYLLFFAYLAGSCISLAAVLMEELTYRRYSKLGELFRLLAYAFLDFFPYRQFLVFCRIWGMVEYFRRPHTWGEQRRKGFLPRAASG